MQFNSNSSYSSNQDPTAPREIFNGVILHNLSLYFKSDIESCERNARDYSDKGLMDLTSQYERENRCTADIKKYDWMKKEHNVALSNIVVPLGPIENNTIDGDMMEDKNDVDNGENMLLIYERN